MKLSNSLKDLSSGQLPTLCQCSTGQRENRETMRTYSGTFLTCGVKSLTHCPFGKLCESSAMHFLFLWTLEWTKAGGWGGQGDSALSAGGLVCTWDRVTPERRQRAAFIILSALTRREAEPLSIGVVRQKLKSCGRDTRTDAVTSPREIITDTQWIWIGGCSSCENGH